MKKTTIMLIVALLFASLGATELIVLNSASQTLSKIDLLTHVAVNNFANAGLYGNQVYFEDDELWLVNSGDNNIQKISIESGAVLQTIQLPNSSNPWNMLKNGDYIYVSGMMSSDIYRIDTNTNAISTMSSGVGPEGMLIVNNELYVANTGFQYPDYSQGTVSVFNLETFEKQTEILTSINPQAMILASDGNIHLMCTGDYYEAAGSIQIIDPVSKSIIDNIEIGGCPNSIIESPDQIVYLADGMGLGFYSYDVNTHEIIHSNTNAYLPGGSKMLFLEDQKLVLNTGDWFSNSHLLHLDADDVEIYDYSLGVGAVDLVLIESPQSNNEVVHVKESLIEAYPNPFRSQIQLKSKQDNIEEMSVYNIKGEKVKTLITNQWDGRDARNQQCANGIYYILAKLKDGSVSTKKITYLK